MGGSDGEEIGKVHALFVDADEQVTIGRSRAEIAKAPGYDPDLEELKPVDDLNDLYGYYGMTPFWTPGYRYPGFPFR